MNVPVFIDISMDDQAQELRSYLKSLSAEISEEKSPKGIEDDLHKIIGVCDACLKEGNEAEIEGVLNGIVSMLVLIPVERSENLILAFGEKLAKAPNNKLALVCLHVLWLLFHSLDERSPMRYHIYYQLVSVAGRVGQVGSCLSQGVEGVRQQLSGCPPTSDQMQKLLRLMHEALVQAGRGKDASKVMVELLGTYTSENASQAREDAQRCIIASLADPNTFLLDHLLALKPVKFLEGELIHDLLTIFVSEKLPAYVQFYSNHREFVNSLGLSHEQNLKKMRLLTFMQMAETSAEVPFATVAKELQLPEDQVEEFVIDVLRTKLVRARMDQSLRKVHISSTMHRTFGRQQWQQLKDELQAWKESLANVKESMHQVVTIPLDLMPQA